MADTSLVFNAVGRDRGVNSLLARTAAGVKSSNAAAAASTVAYGAAMASAAAHAMALAVSARAAAGAAALVPAAVAGTVALVGAARTVTFGLADAWTATGQAATAGGGSSVNTARRVATAQRQVEQATRGLVDAQRAALAAQAAVTAARAAETERLQDLTRSLAGARLDEEAAVDAVTAAQERLAEVQRAGGDPTEIHAADLAYRQSMQTLDEVRDRVGDLGAEQTDSQRKGVEGSDQVQEALRRQAEAQQAVTDAAQRLADAQDAVRDASAQAAAAGIDPAAEALARLSPAGRAVILTLRALVPAWQAAGRAGQQATLAGVAGDLRDLSALYLPRTTGWLTRMGTAFNFVLRDLASWGQSANGSRTVDAILGSTAATTERLARAVRPVVNGVAQFVQVGASFLPGLAGNVGDIATRFERWAVAARQSGQMQQWISTGVTTLRQFGQIAGNVVGIVMAIFRAGGDGGATVANLVRMTTAARAWVDSAEGQQRITQIFATLREILGGLADGFANTDAPAGTLLDTLSVGGTVVSFLADHTDTLATALPYLATGFLLVKAAQVASNAAAVVAVPIRIAEIFANRRLAASITAQTAALTVNKGAQATSAAATGVATAATVTGDVATKRSVISMVAQRTAMIASSAAARVAAAGQWILNAALSANPIGLIVLAVIALIAGIVLLWRNSETFRTIVTGAFNAVWGAIKAVWDWVSTNWRLLLAILTGPIGLAVLYITRHWDSIKAGASSVWTWITNGWNRMVGFITGLPGRVSRAASGLWNGIWNGWRNILNRIIAGWNNLTFTIGGGSIAGINIPSLTLSTPDLPYLATGGTVTRDGLAVVGENGPEVVSLGAGASVVPLPSGGGGGPAGTVKVIVVGGDRDAIAYLRRLNQQYGI